MISHDNAVIHANSQAFVRHPTAGVLAPRYDGGSVATARIEPQRKDLVSKSTSVRIASVWIFVHRRLGLHLGVISESDVGVFPGSRVECITA